MKYADKVIELMAAYPGREFRMMHIVNYINPRASKQEKWAIRDGVSTVFLALVETGQIVMRVPKTRGSFALYAWKVRGEVLESTSESERMTAG